MFKKLFNLLFTEEVVAPPSQGEIQQFDATQFKCPVIGYLIPQSIQNQLRSLNFPSLHFTSDLNDIHHQNKTQKEMVLLFPIRIPEITAKEFVKSLRDENPSLTTQLIVITDKFNKEELITLLRQRINGILLLPLSKDMIGTVFSRLNLLPNSLKPHSTTGDSK